MLEFLEPVRGPHAPLPAGVLSPSSLFPETTTGTAMIVNVIALLATASASNVGIRFIVLPSGWGSFTAHYIHLMMRVSILAS